jgi:hypothetical protein
MEASIKMRALAQHLKSGAEENVSLKRRDEPGTENSNPAKLKAKGSS